MGFAATALQGCQRVHTGGDRQTAGRPQRPPTASFIQGACLACSCMSTQPGHACATWCFLMCCCVVCSIKGAGCQQHLSLISSMALSIPSRQLGTACSRCVLLGRLQWEPSIGTHPGMCKLVAPYTQAASLLQPPPEAGLTEPQSALPHQLIDFPSSRVESGMNFDLM